MLFVGFLHLRAIFLFFSSLATDAYAAAVTESESSRFTRLTFFLIHFDVFSLFFDVNRNFLLFFLVTSHFAMRCICDAAIYFVWFS